MHAGLLFDLFLIFLNEALAVNDNNKPSSNGTATMNNEEIADPHNEPKLKVSFFVLQAKK